MINATLLAQWCQEIVSGTDQAPEFKVSPGTSVIIPELQYPDNLGLVTMMSGSGTEMEGATRKPAFQLKIRGLLPYYDEIALQADMIDRQLMSGPWGALWGTWINSVDHVGGEPAPDVDDASAQRVVFTCAYIVREILQGATR